MNRTEIYCFIANLSCFRKPRREVVQDKAGLLGWEPESAREYYAGSWGSVGDPFKYIGVRTPRP